MMRARIGTWLVVSYCMLAPALTWALVAPPAGSPPPAPTILPPGLTGTSPPPAGSPGTPSSTTVQPPSAELKAKYQKMKSVTRDNTPTVDDRDILKAMEEGYDPPMGWRNNEGKDVVKAGGSGGYSIGGRSAPGQSPGWRGAKSSVSAGLFNFTLKFPPWRGFPCQIPGGVDVCGGSDKGNGTGGTGGAGAAGGGAISACPIATDADASFGNRQTFAASGALPLACGGAIPLSPANLTLTANPTSMLVSDAGSRTLTVFTRSGNDFTRSGSLVMPSFLCNALGEQTVTVRPPTAQIIGYTGGSIAIRLQSEDPAEVNNPFDIDPTPDPDTVIEPERFLLVPVRGGVPDMPKDCALADDYYRTLPALTAPLSITFPNNDGGLASTASAPSACDTVTTTPTGTACAGKIQFAVLDTPNILYPANSAPDMNLLSGSTSYIAHATAASRLYVQAETLGYFGAQGGAFVLPEGGIMKLDNGERLVMNGPATINAAARSVTLTAGGSIQGFSGATTQTVSPGRTIAPAASLPYIVKINRNVELPAGYAAPTLPNAYVRLPIATQ